MLKPPSTSEYATFYAGYVSHVADADVVAMLESQISEVTEMFADRPDELGAYSYAPEKWTVNEVVGHMADTERIMAYRLLRFLRGDGTPLPGFEQDDYVAASNFGSRTLTDLVAEFLAVRRANLYLYHTVTEDLASQGGMMSGSTVSVRGLIFIIAGHVAHHLSVLKDRYGMAR